ncbi:hypothetical protein [Paenibacillus hamazuiensis]|uniref:hypothetical protein n=1 Tax=Paenibacillus hamazuiensis TaxID=2936508 RepID=UPI00200EFAC5|nr:hypothetical protein [Paenibacillus hamazuiensis]
MAKDTYHLPVDSTANLPMFEGFRYFSPIDIASLERHTQFICGYMDDRIVGVLKFHRCKADTHELIGEQDKAAVPNYLEVRYVDVDRRWHNIGVATALIQGFSARMTGPETVVVSPLTADGRRANLLGKFREHLSRSAEGPILSVS